MPLPTTKIHRLYSNKKGGNSKTANQTTREGGGWSISKRVLYDGWK